MRDGERRTKNGSSHGEQKQEKRKKRLYERAAELFGLPSDAVGLSDGFMAEMRGRCGVTVRGCRRILSYSEEAVTLLTRDGRVTVKGAGLTCATYYRGAIGIDGRIDALTFEETPSGNGGGRI